MIYIRTLLIITLSIFLLSSCSSVMVNEDFDSSVSFSAYNRFSLEEKDPNRKTDPRYDNELINNRFNRKITEVLLEKGFSKQYNGEKSDFTVSFNYSIRPKMDLYNISKQVGFSYGSYNRYGGIGAKTCTDISEFDQGILFINIKDATTGKLVWRGTGTDIVSIYATPEKLSSQVEEMVTAVLSNFPPN